MIIVKKILPSPVISVLMFALPILLTVYFILTHYSNRFISEQNLNYFDVQNNWLGLVFLDQAWIEWFNRLMDFAFWGVLAAIVLVGAWLFSAAKVATKNHYAQEDFVNFHESKSSWHSHFFIVAALKVLLVFVILFAIFALIGQRIPALATEVSQLTQHFSWEGVLPAVYAGLYLVFLQFVMVICINLFRLLRAN